MSSIINCYYDYEVQRLSGNLITENINTVACTTDEMKSLDMIDRLGGSPFLSEEDSYPILDGYDETIVLPEIKLSSDTHIFSNSAVTLSVVIVNPGSNTNYSYTWYRKRILSNTSNSDTLQPYLSDELSEYLPIQIAELGDYKDYTTYEVIPDATTSSITIDSKTDIFSYYCKVNNLNGSVNSNIVGVCILDGQGTANNPFQIENIHQFYSMQWLSAQNNLGGPYNNSVLFFEQTEDLYFNILVPEYKSIPIPGIVLHYNGKGYSLNNLDMITDTKISNIGIFEELASGSEIINLGLNNIDINITSTSTSMNAGILSGECSNIIIDNVYSENCNIISNLDSSANGSYNFGGIIGYIPSGAPDVTISNCYSNFNIEFTNSLAITSSRSLNIGGLVGINGNFINCYYAGKLVDGIFNSEDVNPISNNGDITNCYYDSDKYVFDSGNTVLPDSPVTTELQSRTTSQMQNEDILDELGKSYYLL